MEKIKEALDKLVKRKDLTRKESFSVFKDLIDGKYGKLNDIYLGSFLASMQTKNPTKEEITGLMDVVLKYDRVPLRVTKSEKFCGIVGSGRDTIKTINISTAAAIIASGLGVKVVKNGCRSESSVSGTTDVLEELGVNIHAKSLDMIKSLEENNIGFFDAEPYFPKMFNEYVGKFPFINPLSYALSVASAIEFKRMIFGLSSPDTEFTVSILKEMGFKFALVVQGSDEKGINHIDELSTLGKTKISELKNGKIKTYFLYPKEIGLRNGKYQEIAQHKTNQENSLHLVKILLGKSNRSSIEIVALNTGALLYISGKEKTLKAGVDKSLEYIYSGEAIKQLERLVMTSKGDIKKLNKYLYIASKNNGKVN
jgi:anthranilate phosphoribosyltransferase